MELSTVEIDNGWKALARNNCNALIRAAKDMFKKKEESGLMRHAKRELELAGYDLNQKEEDPNKWIVENILELISVFSKQGHSGMSAPYCISMFKDLASYKLLTPLTGKDDEWNEVSEYFDKVTYQNNRCGSVFKEGKDGVPYYLDAIVWKTQEDITFGGCVEGISSSQNIKGFPFTPKTFYVDVTSTKVDEDDYEDVITNPSDLEEVFKYYDMKEVK